MHIELYLRDIMQDFPDNKSSLSTCPENCDSWNDSPPWYNPWTNQPWYQTMDSKIISDSKEPAYGLTGRIKMRKEKFGGIIFDPLTAVVYKADAKAYKFIELVKAGSMPDEAGRKMKLQHEECNDFLKELKKLGLWSK